MHLDSFFHYLELLFLDEPTTGLDSSTALSVMKIMRKITENSDRSVICTIHQPRWSILKQFDKVRKKNRQHRKPQLSHHLHTTYHKLSDSFLLRALYVRSTNEVDVAVSRRSDLLWAFSGRCALFQSRDRSHRASFSKPSRFFSYVLLISVYYYYNVLLPQLFLRLSTLYTAYHQPSHLIAH